MLKTVITASNVNPALIALKPRQVLLANPTMMTNNKKKAMSLDSDQKTSLLRSLAKYFHDNGFNKTLKKFLKEAHLQKDDVQDASLDLEEMCSKHLETRSNQATKNLSIQKEQDATMATGPRNDEDGIDTAVKKNRKKSGESDGSVVANQSEASGKTSEKVTTDLALSSVKSKEKKKGKKESDVGGENENIKSSTDNILSEPQLDGGCKKEKDKKNKKTKKKLGSVSEADIVEQHSSKTEGKSEDHVSSEGKSVIECDKENISKSKKKRKNKPTSGSHVDSIEQGDATDPQGVGSGKLKDVDGEKKKEKKDSKKKRKRESSGNNDSKSANGETVEKSKCKRKSENVDQPTENKATLASDEHCVKKIKGENGQISLEASRKTVTKELNEQDNGHYKKDGQKSASKSSSKKQRESSSEPKTVNAFQRVKVDEVVFTDQRLQDNSYWAKDGADSGYGAKAQEVLGQVRGRDFRHEKTKKKRGSYRGGQIDLLSHSIKFDNSDEE